MYSLQRIAVNSKILLTLYENSVSCGFPSPAFDYLQKPLDLNELMIRKPASTFLVRASGSSMTGANIHDGDILVVDRSLTPKNGSVVLAVLDGEFLVKRFYQSGNRVELHAENQRYPPIVIDDERQFELFGVITFSIYRHES